MASPENQQQPQRPFSWEEFESMPESDYISVNWRQVMDLGRFEQSCFFKACWVGYVNRGTPVPWRCRNCRAGLTRLRLNRMYENHIEQEEAAAEDARARTERAEEENPGLFRQDKIWQPWAPGVAVIRGDMLADVASFFRDCDVAVREHNQPVTDRALAGRGADILALSGDAAHRHFFGHHAQVRVRIERFHPPPWAADPSSPGEAALCNLQSHRGNAICGLIIFLGSTGDHMQPGAIDIDCSYWLYFPGGLSSGDIRDIGDSPFGMVRVGDAQPGRRADPSGLMLRLGIPRGNNNKVEVARYLTQTLRQWTIRPLVFDEFDWGSLQNVEVEPGGPAEPEAPSRAHSAEAQVPGAQGPEAIPSPDPSSLSDISGVSGADGASGGESEDSGGSQQLRRPRPTLFPRVTGKTRGPQPTPMPGPALVPTMSSPQGGAAHGNSSERGPESDTDTKGKDTGGDGESSITVAADQV